MLARHGDRFIGDGADYQAGNWLDNGFDSRGADGWCKVGVWDAGAAARLRDAGLTPSRVKEAAESLVQDDEDAFEIYVGGDLIYSVCNKDIDASVIIDAAEAPSRGNR